MRHWEEELEAAVAAWRARGWPRPDVMVVSGSGLAVDLGEPEAAAPLADLLPFPVHAVAGHPLRVEILRPVPDRTVLYSRGRLHAYQGYEPGQVVFTVRLAARLGARTLLLSNAAGGIDPSYAAGDLVLIRDQINLSGMTPLWGEPPAAWGPRFPDLVDAYSPELRALARAHGIRQGLTLGEGVYVGLSGPAYETPAEVRMLRAVGGDLVGMSTVLEVIAARHMGLRCLGLSLVANPAAGVSPEPLVHADVLAAGARAARRVQGLFAALIADPALG
jgi:purine-nucleoside phosphorylase